MTDVPAQHCTYIDSSGARHPGVVGTWPVHYMIQRKDGAMAKHPDCGALLWYLDRDTAQGEALRHAGVVVDGDAYDE